MRKWSRVAYQERCGLCGSLLGADTPVMEITLPNSSIVKYRCEDCVGSAPPDLPARISLSETIETKMARIRELATVREWMPYKD